MTANFYDSALIEKKINDDWKKKSVLKKVEKLSKDKPKFYFLDGPPFVTNEVHEGTMLGIFMKDAILRYKILKGFDVRMQPGWDTHGLPIEVMVEKRLGIKNKKEIKEFGEEKFADACKKFVEEHIKLNTSIMLDYGVLWYNNKPYKTYDESYIESIWSAIKKANEMGLLYKGFKSTWFCVRCGTPMANYEVRDKYYDKEDTSVYVLFQLEDGRYLLVWTTTPWTLPSNVAIAVNSNFTYIEIDINGKTVIIAKEREKVLKDLGIQYSIKKEINGKDLIGLKYKPLFPDIPQVQENIKEMCKVIDGASFISEEGIPFVEIDAGTGLVHTAPGHGESDYKIGMANKLPILSPVTEDGKFTYKAGWLENEDVLTVNEKIIKDLQEEGVILGTQKVLHKYPHCWRCKTPLIPRASDQWFLNINKIKNELTTLSKEINWVPPISHDMFESWLSNAQDWVISRQRYWNTPMPIWECAKCAERIVIANKKELLMLSGKKTIKDLHKASLENVKIKCPKCSSLANRVNDVMDVWIDSGSASFADLGYPTKTKEFEKWFPADFICEGNDQVRGWFYSLLVIGYIATSKIAYKNVMMHRFVVGENGNKLSKSEGNYKPLSELLKEGYSRDALRLSLIRHKLEDVAVFSINGLSEEVKSVNVIYNLGNLYLSIKNLFKNKKSEDIHFKLEDKWILSRWNNTKKAVAESLNSFRTDYAIDALLSFLTNDFSRTYIKLAKSRIFDENDYAAFQTFYGIFRESAPVISIFAPYIAEYSYSLLGEKESVMLSAFPKINEELIDPNLEKRMQVTMSILQDLLAAREKMKLPVKRPLNAIFLPGIAGDLIIEEILRTLGNILHINYELKENDFDIALNFKELKNKYKQEEITEITTKFIEYTKGTIFRSIGRGINILSNSKEFKLTDMDIELKPKMQGFEVLESQGRKVVVDKTLTDEVGELWLRREITRSVQSIRKEFSMQREDPIRLVITVNGVSGSAEVNALTMNINEKTNAVLKSGGKLLKIQNLSVDKYNVVISVFK